MSCLQGHSDLRLCYLDLAETLKIHQLQDLVVNKPKLKELKFRDQTLALPVTIGRWHTDFEPKATAVADLLAMLPTLETLCINMEPVLKLPKNRLGSTGPTKDSFETLAARLYRDYCDAARLADTCCVIEKIVLNEVAITISNDDIFQNDLSYGRVFEFPKL